VVSPSLNGGVAEAVAVASPAVDVAVTRWLDHTAVTGQQLITTLLLTLMAYTQISLIINSLFMVLLHNFCQKHIYTLTFLFILHDNFVQLFLCLLNPDSEIIIRIHQRLPVKYCTIF
jgi:hypothetical protein